MIQDLPKSLLEDSKKLLQQGADYEKFFKAALKKFGVSSPADFKSDEEKKKFFDYVDKNYKGEKSESVKKYSRSYRLDEASLNYVYFDKPEATRFASKIKSFVDSVEIEKMIAGHFNVIVKGDKKALKKATDVAIKMSESVEHTSLNLQEGKKGKYKSKKQNNIIRDIEKLKKQEKKDGHDVKDIDAIQKMIKKGLETEMYDDMEIMTGKTLKTLDKHMMNMDTMPREDIAQIIMKQDIDLYDMIFGY